VSSDPTTSTGKMVLSLSRSQKPVIHSLQVRKKHLPEDKQFWTQRSSSGPIIDHPSRN
jgi:hypothetical protein